MPHKYPTIKDANVMPDQIFVHLLSLDDQTNLVASSTIENSGFNPSTYSLAKHGHSPSIDQAALDVYRKIITSPELLSLFEKEDVAFVTDGRFVPTSSRVLITKVIDEYLNPHLKSHGLSKAFIVYSEQAGQVTDDDYGKMSLTERAIRMAQRAAYFTDKSISQLANRPVILFDDLTITGTYEKDKVKLLEKSGVVPKNIHRLYWVKVDEKAAAEPKLESKINNSKVVTLDDMLEIYHDKDAVINIRAIKFIFREKLDHQRRLFERIVAGEGDPNLAQYGAQNLKKLYEFATSIDGYHLLPNYAPGIEQLGKIIKSL